MLFPAIFDVGGAGSRGALCTRLSRSFVFALSGLLMSAAWAGNTSVISGIVNIGGVPQAGAQVAFSQSGASTICTASTGVDGSYSCSVPNTGLVTVTATQTGYGFQTLGRTDLAVDESGASIQGAVLARSMAGTVKDAGGSALSGVSVTWQHRTSGGLNLYGTCGTTGASGAYNCNVPAGTVWVLSSQTLYAFTQVYRSNLTVDEANVDMLGTALVRTIAGTVKDGTGSPVSGATVTWSHPSITGSFSGSCGPSATGGTFACHVPQGFTGTVRATLGGNNQTFLAAPLTRTNVISDEAGADIQGVALVRSIAGIVRDAAGSPISGATVRFSISSLGNLLCGTTAADGAYACHVPQGFTGSVYASLGTGQTYAFVMLSRTNLIGDETGANITGIALVRSIAGTVKDSSGNLLSGAQVSWYSTSLNLGVSCSTTVSDGAYTCHVPDGFTGTLSAYFSATGTSILNTVTNVTADLTGQTIAPVNYNIAGTAVVAGVVQAGVQVDANWGSSGHVLCTASTGADGSFSCSVPNTGTITITATKAGYAYQAISRSNIASAETGASIQGAALARTMAGTVKDASGAPLSGVSVTWQSSSANLFLSGACGTTGASGAYSCSVPAGAVWVLGSQTGYAFVQLYRSNLTVDEANADMLGAALVRTITGTVKDGAGNPTIGAYVNWNASNSTGYFGGSCGSISADGTYTCHVPQGFTGSVSASLGNGQTFVFAPLSRTNLVSDEAGANILGIALMRTISGTVKDGSGNLLSGVQVNWYSPSLKTGRSYNCGTTVADGVYTCHVPQGFTGSVNASLGNGQTYAFVSQSRTNVVSDESGASIVGIALVRSITGTVRDGSGNLLSGVQVDWNSPSLNLGVYCGTTLADGVYTCHVPNGFTGSVTAYASSGNITNTFANVTADLTGQTVAPVNYAISGTVVVAGVVQAGAQVDANWGSSGHVLCTASTGADGSFSCSVPNTGTITIKATQVGYAYQAISRNNVAASETGASIQGATLARTMAGTVKDASGAPISGASVTWQFSSANLFVSGACGTTGANGSYSCSVPAGQIWVLGSETGYAFTQLYRSNLTVDEANADMLGAALVRSISGTVKDGSGNPISGVNVNWNISNSTGYLGSSCGSTSADGTFTCHLPLGFTGRVSANQGSGQTYVFVPISRTNLVSDETGASVLGIALVRTISGTVKDGSGNLLSGVQVNWYSPSLNTGSSYSCGLTAADGAYTCHVPDGFTGNVNAYLGNSQTYAFVSLSRNNLVSDETGANFAGIALVRSISGTVKDSSGNLLSGVQVNWNSPSLNLGVYCGTTAADGVYNCHVPDGFTGGVTAYAPGASITSTFTNVTADLTGQTIAPVNYAISGTVLVAGVVQAGAQVDANWGSSGHVLCTASTGADGSFSCSVPNTGTITIKATQVGYAYQAISRNNVAASETGASIQGATLARTMAGTVKDASGAPISGASVTWQHRTSTSVYYNGTCGTTGASGAYSCSVPAGQVWVLGSQTGYAYAQLYRPNLTADEANADMLGAALVRTITGIVKDSTGNPITGAYVSWSASNSTGYLGGSCGNTAADGVYTCHVPQGFTGSVSAYLGNGQTYAFVSLSRTNVVSDETGANFAGIALVRSISGTAKDSSGNLLSGVQVDWNSPSLNLSFYCNTTVADGVYTCHVPDGFTGRLIAYAPGGDITSTFTNVTADLAAQTLAPVNYTVSGTVVVAGLVQAGAQVDANWGSSGHVLCTASTGADGSFSCSVPNTGTITITATKAGYAYQAISRNNLAASETGASIQGAALARTMAGTITDASGNPLNGVSVTWQSSSTNLSLSGTCGTTGVSGAYSCSVPAGAVWVLGSQTGYAFVQLYRSNLTVDEANADMLGAALVRTIAGTVIDGSGNPISGVNVNWNASNSTVYFGGSCGSTAADGAYTCHVPQGFAGTLTAFKLMALQPFAFAPLSRTNVVADETGANIYGLALVRSISGAVKDASGNPLSGRYVSWSGVTSTGTFSASCGNTLADGSYTCHVPEGFTGTVSASLGMLNSISAKFTNVTADLTGQTISPWSQLSSPGVPTGVTAIAGNASVSVAFTAPASNGGTPVTGYAVTSTPGGITASGVTSPITLNGLINGTSYTFTVVATNGAGSGIASAPSNVVVPNNNKQLIGALNFSPPILTIGGSTTVNAIATSGLVVSFSSATPSICTISGNAITGVAVGNCIIAADQAGNGTYTPAPPVTQNLVVNAAQVMAAGNSHTCALTGSGGVKCWGYNLSGQLGDGSTTDRLTAVDVIGLTSGVTALVAGNSYTCALTSSGGVKCWGYNYYGQLGDGSTANRLTPVDVSGLASGVVSIAAGGGHACALTSGGAVKCWGRNSAGQLGDGTTVQRLTPVDVPGLTGGVVALAAGYLHTCAITSGGGVKCWGYNYYGELGDNSAANRLTPVDVSGLASGVIAIGAGNYHTCAVTGSGVKCWGYNANGQLGDGSTTNRLTPVDVGGLPSAVIAVSTRGLHSCALILGGAVKCWGNNDSGQLGDGSSMNRLIPVDVGGFASGATAIAAGFDHTCAIDVTGSVRCWGATNYGQVGDGNANGSRLSPVGVSSLASGVSKIAAGVYHNCVLTSAGAVQCWGWNSFGQLGDGSGIDRLAPVNVIGLASGVSVIASGDEFTCALVGGGGVKCWGDNGFGQLGDGTLTQRATPVNVTALTSGVIAIAGGNAHTCAITSGGGVKCWGDNSSGQIGDGTTTQRLTPVDVLGLASGVIAIEVSDTHSCALTSAGGVKCWGDNSFGQLGDGTTTSRTTPVDVVGLTSGVVAIANAYDHSCALTSSGGVKCWGRNNYSQLGDGTTTQQLTPVDVVGLTSGVSAITSGTIHGCALTTSGGVKCWGGNANGQVGDNSTTTRATAVDVVGLASGVSAISAGGGFHTCALTTSGGVTCWGNNLHGQLGDGTMGIRPQATLPVLGFSSPAPASQAITFGTAPTLVVGGTTTVSATGGASGNPVTFTSTTTGICTVSGSNGSTVGGVAAGTCTIAANQAGNSLYIAAPQVTQNITVATTTTTTTTSSTSTTSTTTSTTTTTTQVGANINLVPSWNLVGNGVEAPIAVASAFNDATKVTTVWKWVTTGSTPGMTYPAWAFYTPVLADGGQAYAASKGYEFLSTILAGEGFWVNAKAAVSVAMPAGSAVQSSSFMPALPGLGMAGGLHALPKGWSLIATGDSPTPTQFDAALATFDAIPPAAGSTSVYTNLTTLWAWDPSRTNWYFWAPVLVNNAGLASYLTSKGYLDFGTLPSTPAGRLTPATGVWVNMP